MHRTLLSTGCVAAFATLGFAQSFNYPNFTSTTGLTFSGNAAQSGNLAQVTPALGNQKGAFYYSTPVNVSSGFDTTFTWQMTALNAGGADGMAFVIQNDIRGTAAYGDQGSSMAYGAEPTSPVGTAISNCIAVELDTYYIGVPWGDPNGNHISIHTNGTGENNAQEAYSIGIATPGINLSDTFTHTMRVLYDGTRLKVYIAPSTTPLIDVPYSFSSGGTWLAGGTVGGLSLIGGTSAYVGFTAGTGGAWETHDIVSWSFTGLGPVAYCTGGTSANGCVASISANANPSVSYANPCLVTVASVEGQKSGIIFYGLMSLAQPWAVGSSSYLCVKAPTQRTGTQNSGGTLANCDGVLSLDWNLYQQNHPSALGAPWSVGQTAYAQGWYRDPPAPKTTSLSNAVMLTYQP